MSIKAMNWVWESSRTVGNDRLVLLAIADRASDEGMDAWPSVSTLAGKTRLHERTVQRCIRNVEALGELEVRRSEGRQGTNVYIVRMDALALSDSRPRRRRVTPKPPSDSGGSNNHPGNLSPGGNTPGGGSATGGVAAAPPGGGGSATGGVAAAPPDSSGTSCTSGTNTAASPQLAFEEAKRAPTQMRRDTKLALAKEPNGGNYQVIAKLARALLDAGNWTPKGSTVRIPIENERDLVDALKDECARLRIDRGSNPDVPHDVIHRAAASEWLKHQHPEWRRDASGGKR